jgi:hypothetical protein
MEKLKIHNIVSLGKTCRVNSIGTELSISKLLTSIILNPGMGINVDIVSDNGNIVCMIDGVTQVYDRRGERVQQKIELGENVGISRHGMQLKDATDNMYYTMARSGHLSNPGIGEKFGKVNDILYSTLQNVSNMFESFTDNQKSSYLEYINGRVLQLNAFRKLISNSGRKSFDFDKQVERVLATTLGCVNYFTNSDNNPIENFQDKPFVKIMEDITNINRGISYGADKDYSINNYACARTELEDRKAEYLAGLNYTKFSNNDSFKMSGIDVLATNQVMDAVTETASHMW